MVEINIIVNKYQNTDKYKDWAKNLIGERFLDLSPKCENYTQDY